MPKSELRSFRDLESWQRAMELAVACYRFAQRLPRHEQFGLASQLRRAAVSVPSNIAEGYGRRARGDYLRALSIARGSLMEVETQLSLAHLLEYGNAQEWEPVMILAQRTGALLNAHIRSLGGRARDRPAGNSRLAPDSRSPAPPSHRHEPRHNGIDGTS